MAWPVCAGPRLAGTRAVQRFPADSRRRRRLRAGGRAGHGQRRRVSKRSYVV